MQSGLSRVGLGKIGQPLLYHMAKLRFSDLVAAAIGSLRVPACESPMSRTNDAPGALSKRQLLVGKGNFSIWQPNLSANDIVTSLPTCRVNPYEDVAANIMAREMKIGVKVEKRKILRVDICPSSKIEFVRKRVSIYL